MTTFKPFNWICPICSHATTITKERLSSQSHVLNIDNAEGPRMLTSVFIICPNEECSKFSLEVRLAKTEPSMSKWWEGEVLRRWQLVPQSKAQSFPNYIPKVVLDDYNEACLIMDLSPKASASLARRCLQGMIRDFWKGKVKPGKLGNEIEQIKDKVEPLTWQAIDAVRSVGNIGAHMEEDVNLIIDIEPDEAQLLMDLIEILLKDWYIARHERESRLQELVQLGADKETARKIKKVSSKKK